MKTFCAILLVGFIAYVGATHNCDPLAANIEKKDASTGEHHDQILLLDLFPVGKENSFIVTDASESELTGSNRFCTALTHGNNCKAVEHYNIVTKSGKGVNAIQFKSEFLGVSGAGKAIKYEMVIQGNDVDDYIFKIAAGTKIKAVEFTSATVSTDVSDEIPVEVKNVLEGEFALYHSTKDFTIFITCDAKIMWVSYQKSAFANRESSIFELDNQVKKLQAIAKTKFGEEPKLVPIETTVPQAFQGLISAAA